MIRIRSITLEQFKNVARGAVLMPADPAIVGLYGPNGSGKTAVIEALGLLKRLMAGLPLPEDADRYIAAGADRMTLTLGFSFDGTEGEYAAAIGRGGVVLGERARMRGETGRFRALRPDSAPRAALGQFARDRLFIVRQGRAAPGSGPQTAAAAAQVSPLLGALVPGLSLEARGAGADFQLLTRRGGVRVPLDCESDGIVRLISILTLFVRAYNEPSFFLAVDELDAGVFEYLLGELLSAFEKGARGQLLFTSHNLRPLEMIDPGRVVFSTDNPENRYIRLRGRAKRNLRDQYLRGLLLGGQAEEIGGHLSGAKIARALRLAGKAADDAGKN